jgi:hypothetical protein
MALALQLTRTDIKLREFMRKELSSLEKFLSQMGKSMRDSLTKLDNLME